MEDKELQELEEFTLEDIIKEFSDHPVAEIKEEETEAEPVLEEIPEEAPAEEPAEEVSEELISEDAAVEETTEEIVEEAASEVKPEEEPIQEPTQEVTLEEAVLSGDTIRLDSPGPVLFRQKRVGLHKSHFNILKFRTMRIDTPRDMPTHLLENPEQWITKVGGFLRKTSLDELPQIFNIFLGQMSVIGPRPALWNQYDLIAERDKYGANDVVPGLTGWAQINGRDELPIDVKARLDGEYVERMSFLFDVKCFFGTVTSVLKRDGVVEGGTGAMEKEQSREARK